MRVEEGDILLVRTGHASRLDELGPWDTASSKAGLHPSCAEFLAERRIAALGCDGNNDTAPSFTEGVGFPIHVLALTAMGVHLLDYLHLDELGGACEDAGRWEFLFVGAPLRIAGGTGSPLNPIAILDDPSQNRLSCDSDAEPGASSRGLLVQPAGGAQPDGLHARVPHHPGLLRGRLPGDDADRRVPGRRRNDEDALRLARNWSKAVAVMFAVGAVTGTVLSFEFGLLWPRFMDRFGDAFGIAFAIEGIFFFLEAIFIAIYIYGWDRLSPRAHMWAAVPIVISGSAAPSR